MSIKPMKAKHLKDIPENKLMYPMMVFEKYDGIFCHIYKNNDRVYIESRQGKPLIGFEWLSELFNVINEGEHIFGELYNPNIDFDTHSGLVRNHDEYICNLMVFDEYYEHQDGEDTFGYRYEVAKSICNLIADERIKMVAPLTTINHVDDAQGLFNKITAGGSEGLIYRPVHSVYKPGKRSNDYIKVKIGLDVDVPLVKVIEALEKDTNMPLGMAGSCTVIYEGKEVTVGMGNLNHDQRKKLWEQRDKYKGVLIEVKAMSITANGAFRHGNIYRIREDKSE